MKSELTVSKFENSIFSCNICNYDYEERQNKPQVYEVKLKRIFTNGSQSESFRLCKTHLKELHKKITSLVEGDGAK